MGCQSTAFLENALTFSICTHDADTGALTDTSAPPAYRIYEDETATAILNGTMAKLDDANTTGFYTEKITCSAANGFEVGKSYTLYIEATVDSITGGVSYAFTVDDKTGYALSSAGIAAIWAYVIENGKTVAQFVRGIKAAVYGILSGAATTTVVVRDDANTKNRITVTADADGNRTAVVSNDLD